jgi:hypothetical protein
MNIENHLMLKSLLGVFLFMSFAILAHAAVFCTQDGTLLTWTGNTKPFNGQMLYEHECMNGHKFWLDRAN